MDFLSLFSLDNAYVQHTLFAIASLALGLLGMVLGQRITTGKAGLVFGLVLGGLTVFLLFTPYGYIAPGWCAVFVMTFLLSEHIIKFVCGKGNEGRDSRRDA